MSFLFLPCAFLILLCPAIQASPNHKSPYRLELTLTGAQCSGLATYDLSQPSPQKSKIAFIHEGEYFVGDSSIEIQDGKLTGQFAAEAMRPRKNTTPQITGSFQATLPANLASGKFLGAVTLTTPTSSLSAKPIRLIGLIVPNPSR